MLFCQQNSIAHHDQSAQPKHQARNLPAMSCLLVVQHAIAPLTTHLDAL